ncbi:MAG: phosphohistidine phosphatase SixA [Gemmatimonadaceae bacterium]
MNLLIVRHAIAEDREDFAETGQPDDQRPLTDQGKRKMKKAARGLQRAVDNIDHLATSPLTRAAQTAEIISEVFGIGGAEVVPALVPGARPEEFVEWCAPHGDRNVVAIVGHEPHLSSLAAWLTGEAGGSEIDLKKGAACLIEFDGAAARGGGTLRWLLTPRRLRRLD